MRSELAIPAGSLQCALYAFRGGADAVYLGARQFSARKAAVNFSFEDLRKLKFLCLKEGKKFYLTVNTLVKDGKINELIDLLKYISYIEPDGVIVQDLGVASIIRKQFPNLKLHGSTQLAVHTVEGVRELQKLGFTRVVLSRELSFAEIENIRKQCPDVELKVFIHGALCYGFSGLCMASQNLTGRSANCGECAQICRTWFSCKETAEDGWFFSMKDLCLGEDVKKLQNMGIESLKVEGRMKSPEYCYWAARYYSLLLDGYSERDSLVQSAKEALQVSFSRETTEFFFNQTDKSVFVSSDYPSHKGIKVGTIRKVMATSAEVKFTEPVALRDGLLVVSGHQSAGFAFNCKESRKSYVAAGETAIIDFPAKLFKTKPLQGTFVRCTSRHNLNCEKLNENLPLFARPVDIGIEIKGHSININGVEYPIDVQESINDTDLDAIMKKVFSASDRSLFSCGTVYVNNSSGYKKPFLPLSKLKEIRRDWYSHLDLEFEKNTPEIKLDVQTSEILPDRNLLGLWDEIRKVGGKSYFILSPVMFDEVSYLSHTEELVKSNPGLIVGLNNIAQVKWASEHPEIPVFADFYLYTSNKYAYDLLKQELPNLIGSYELDSETSFTWTGSSFKPPMFVSRVCLRRHGLGLNCSSCSKNNEYHLEQNGKHYRAICKDCISIVLMEQA